MVRLREIPRTATFAWSPGSAPPLIATGTRAGAVDADFSNETQLELWDLEAANSSDGGELQPVGSASVDSRFYDLAWSQPNETQTRGIVAGGLENGSVDMWDAAKLQSGASGSHLSRTSKHSGAVKTLQFNPFKHELLATAGAKGELYITDLSNVANPFRLGTSAARADDFDTVDWNKKVAHILATGSSGGFVTVWDLKAKKESLTLNNHGRKAVSAVAWDPDVPTRLATAIPNDQDPLILMWDLRNSNAPEKILQGHDQGVLSLSWCSQDADLLLSCGKDNRTICWNPHSGKILGEYPVVTNWTFQTRWNPHNPSLLATASFDGRIGVHTIQHTNAQASAAAAAAVQAADGEDFFAKPSFQPQGASFSLPQAPKWLGRPVGASFGFGGKVVTFAPAEKDSRKSKINISTFVVDSAVGEASEKFEEALRKGDLASLCESKVAEARTEDEKADWIVIETLMSDQPRKKLMEYLGFDDGKDVEDAEPTTSIQVNGTIKKDDSSFFDDKDGTDNFLSTLASSKGAKTNSPFQIYTGSESDADKSITKYLMLGQFEQALDICLEEDRMSDAFMIAICGGQNCIDKTQAAYFKQKSGGGPNYLRLLASVVGKNLWDFVYNADLKNWKEVMATLCTFADASEFPDLCEALGDRLEELVQDGAKEGTHRKDANFCYLAGSKLEKVVGNWAQELQESEIAGAKDEDGDSSFSIHARSLQNFIEKVTVFRQATKFVDKEQQLTAGWKLAPLYAKYTEYADVAAAHGQLRVAEKYLDLLPPQYPAAEVARNRVKQATKKAASQGQRQPAAPTLGGQRAQRVVPSYGGVATTQAFPTQSPVAAATPYAPLGTPAPGQPTSSPYAPAGIAPAPYQTSGYQSPQASGYQPLGAATIPQPGQFGMGYQPPQQGQGLPPPPRGFSSSPSVPPAATSKNLSAWNDTPDFGSKPASRRGTPAQALNAVTSPFPNAQPLIPPGPPTGVPYTATQRTTPPLGPPPRGPARISSPPIIGSSLGGEPQYPSSGTTDPYAPPSSSIPAQAQPTVPRGASPYQAPPSSGPPTNRYAPAPGTEPSPQPGLPPTQRQIAPPPNPYAAQPPSAFTPATSQTPQQPAVLQPPPRGPPPGGPPRGPSQHGPSGSGSGSQLTPNPEPGSREGASSRSAKPQPKYPTGDRSHIAPDAQTIYEVLNSEMQRVKGLAPASFKPQVDDTEKRLNILFDQLNEGDVLKPSTVQELGGLADNMLGRDWDGAMQALTGIMQAGSEGNTAWMVGVKRLIGMGKATPT